MAGQSTSSGCIPVLGKRILTAVLAALLISSCASMAPVLTSAALKFGEDVISVASHNTSPQYAEELEQLLLTLLREQTGIDKYREKDKQQAKGRYPQDPYATGGYDQYGYDTIQDPYATAGTQDPYGYGSTQDPYATAGTQDPYGYGSTQDPYATAGTQDPYGYGTTAQDPYHTALANQSYQQRRDSSIHEPISMEAGLLAQKIQPDGQVNLVSVQDGDVLQDGRGNPGAGDKIKIAFKTNCHCYVYIIGIDATGFAAQIFPDPDSSIGNPVTAGQQYLFPEEDIWWGLDDYRGIETVYFVASHQQRRDIEEVIARMASTERRIPVDYKTVQTAAVIPHTRGLVKVQSGQPIEVQTQSGSTYQVSPTDFTSAISGVDLVITRWFVHQ